MSNYNPILIALELNSAADHKMIEKARQVGGEQATYFLVHSVEHMSNYGAAYGVTAGVDVEEILVDEATKAMNKIADEFDIAQSNRLVRVGPAKLVILEEARSIGAQLIVVGSHGRHGMRLLLGSTANAVLHHTECDVLAVRV